MIRPLTFDELAGYSPRLLTESSQLKRRGTVSPDLFLAKWERLYRFNDGVVFGYWTGDLLAGSLGAMIADDLYSEMRIAYELFWNVRRDARLTHGWKELFTTYESWARARGAQSAYLSHWADVPRLGDFFMKLGFAPSECLVRKDF